MVTQLTKSFSKIVLLTFAIFIYSACNKSTSHFTNSNPSLFSAYLHKVPSAMIDRAAPIRFVFNENLPAEYTSNVDLLSNILQINPKLKGQFVLDDAMSIVFVPDPLEIDPKTKYNLTLNLQKVYPSIVDSFRIFNSTVQFSPIYISLSNEYPKASLIHEGKLECSFKIKCNVPLTLEQLKKNIKISVGKKEILDYQLQANSELEWQGTISNLEKTNIREKLIFEWYSLPEMKKEMSKITVDLPVGDEFVITGVKVFNEPSRMVSIYLSDPIDPLIDLRGIISFKNINSQYRLENQGNQINAFFNEEMNSEELDLEVQLMLKNKEGKVLSESFETKIQFSSVKPKVKFLDAFSNYILPMEKEAIIKFQTINLKKVDIEIFKIFSNNVLYNMHVNNGNGFIRETKLGRVIHQETISLDVTEKDVWKTYGVNINKFVKEDPAALYELRITFKPEYSDYDCIKPVIIPEKREDNFSGDPSINSNWVDYWPYEYLEAEGDEEVNYNSEDPCSLNYYTSTNFVRKNILASNICAQAKQSADKKNVLISVLNILDGKFISGAKVKYYDEQLQVLGEAKTNGEGNCTITASIPIAYIIVEADHQYSYLSLNESRSLALSEFNVAGVKSSDGIKSCIYSEREVWRPGDSIFVNIITYSPKKNLPDNFPVLLEFFNNRGIKVFTKLIQESKLGHYQAVIPTSKSYQTGKYNLVCKIANEQFNKSYWIEAIKPNRFIAEWDIPAIDNSNSKTAELKLDVKYLHGASVKYAQTKVEFIYKRIAPDFEDFPNYNFLNLEEVQSTTRDYVFDGESRSDGRCIINLKKYDFSKISGFIQASLLSRIADNTGDISTQNKSFVIKPSNEYIGIRIPESPYGKKLEYDKAQIIDIVCIDKMGKPIKNRKVDVELFKVNWDWWYEVNHNRSSYISDKSKSKVESKSFTTDANGKIKYELKLMSYDRFYVKVTNAENKYVAGDFFYTGWPEDEEKNEYASIVRFSAAKKAYQIGEKVELQLPEAVNSLYLIHIIKDDKILKTYQFESDKTKGKFDFIVTEDMIPNVYVDLSIIQKVGNKRSDLPLRLYGILPLEIRDLNTVLEPQIVMKDKVEPGEEFTVELNEKKNKEMAYQIFIVDEGLLSLTNYKVPDVHSAIFAKEALSLFSFDNINEVIGVQNVVTSNVYSIGGDKAKLALDGDKKSNRFTPVVINGGLHILKPGAKNLHKFKINNYIGAVRVMVVANNRKAFGSTEKSVKVKSDLMAEITCPKVLNTNDNLELPITIFNYNKNISSAEVELIASPNIQISGSKKQTVRFDGLTEKIIFVPVILDKFAGNAFLEAKVHSGSNSSSHKLEFNILNPNPTITEANSFWIEPNQELDLQLTQDKFELLEKQKIEVSNGLASSFTKSIQNLINYPHGCLEQTISAAFPQLYVNRIVNVNELSNEKILENIQAAFSKLKNFQNGDGAFSYWPGSRSVDEWASVYAGHFLVEAKKNSYTVPSGMLESWYKYSSYMSSQFDKLKYSYSIEIQCYRLYVLSKYGKPDFASMNRMASVSGKSLVATWFLAGAYAVAGNKDIAENLVEKLGKDVSPYRDSEYTYGSDFRDHCMIAMILSDMGKQSDARSLLQKISKNSKINSNYTTQENVFFVLAVEKVFGQVGNTREMNYSYFDGKKSQDIKTSKFIMNHDLDMNLNSTKIRNNSKSVIHISLVQIGKLKSQYTSEVAQGISIKNSMTYQNGKAIDYSQVKQGEDIKLQVEVYNNGSSGNIKNLALTTVIPPGFEIRNERFIFDQESQNLDFQDIKDDRVMSYFNLNTGQKKNIVIQLTAAYRGKYEKASIVCEAMYDPNIFARQYTEQIVIR